jgi:DNA-binding HxlR family transcriptional regulator
MGKDLYHEDLDCPITGVLDLISAKWTVQILRELALGPVRTRQFLKVIPGLSMKSLQERLKALQVNGMITREVFDEKLPHVEHSITDRGRRLFNVMTQVKAIAEEMTGISCKCPLEGYGEKEYQCPKRRESANKKTTRSA